MIGQLNWTMLFIGKCNHMVEFNETITPTKEHSKMTHFLYVWLRKQAR